MSIRSTKSFKSQIKSALDRLVATRDDEWTSVTIESESRPDVRVTEEGDWCWVQADAGVTGTTMDPSTDRLSGDPYSAHVYFSWVGELASAPQTASAFRDLDKWCLIRTVYDQEYTDIGSWGVHEGAQVKSLDADGNVTLWRVSQRTFQDVAPSAETAPLDMHLEPLNDHSIASLTEAFQHENPCVRALAVLKLMEQDDADVCDPNLVNLIEDEASIVREKAALALEKLGHSMAAKAWSSLLKADRYSREWALERLLPFGEDPLEDLTEKLKSSDDQEAYTALDALAQIDSPGATLSLIEATKDSRSNMSSHATKLIVGKGGKNVTEVLTELFENEKDEWTKRRRAEHLGKHGDEAAIPILVNALEHESKWVREEVEGSLRRLSWEPSTVAEKAKLYFAGDHEKELVNLGLPALPYILRALDPDEHRGTVTDRTLRHLRGMEELLNEPKIIAAVEKVVLADYLYGVSTASRLLSEMGPPRATASLIKIVEEGPRYYAAEAARSLYRHPCKPVADALLKQLQAESGSEDEADWDERVREASLRSLQSIVLSAHKIDEQVVDAFQEPKLENLTDSTIERLRELTSTLPEEAPVLDKEYWEDHLKNLDRYLRFFKAYKKLLQGKSIDEGALDDLACLYSDM